MKRQYSNDEAVWLAYFVRSGSSMEVQGDGRSGNGDAAQDETRPVGIGFPPPA